MEHLHADDEVRFILDGSGYFDIRDPEDRWIRLVIGKGDLISLPAGIYHKLHLDENQYVKAMRFFAGEPVWKAYYRSEETDNCAARKQYLASLRSSP